MMTRKVFYFLIYFFIINIHVVYAQEEKPKVAVVLSGGGAKGLAHIPLLQTLDSLKIVPDLIVGTSMGSVVGGLYAMGYSGDSIAILVKNIDWDELLGGDISLRDVSVEEKSEFKNYLINLDIAEGKPKINSALLNDQKLREYISTLTYPVFNIKDFDSLSIPYRAVTTDIVNGKEVVIGEGSIGLAMRASMSIPGVFKSVPYNNTLLVDGGIINNFPVDVVKNMGNYFIIGSDVGGGMASKEKLDNITTILFQASMLTSNLKVPVNKGLCDILIDHVPNLTHGTSDFDKGNELYEEGKIATRIHLEELKALQLKLKGFEQRKHQLPEVVDEIVLDTIIYKNISEANLDLVKARTDLSTHQTLTTQSVIDGINRAMGTTRFSQIIYRGIFEDDKIGLELNGYEHAKHQIKGSIHYDTYRSVGLIMNYTGRNLIGQASRFFVSVDIAEQPRFRIQYQKNFGKNKTLWWRTEVFGEFLKQKIFVNGEVADGARTNFFQFDNQLNKNLNSLKSYAGLGISYEYTQIRPAVDPEIDDNVIELDHYHFDNVELYGHYNYSIMNQVFYPTQGRRFEINVGRSVIHDVNLKYADNSTFSLIGSTNGFTKLVLNYEERLKINKVITGILGATTGFIFEDAIQSGDIPFSDVGYAAKYFLGGNLINSRKGRFNFPGLHEDELNANQFIKLHLGIQFMPFNKFYFTPHVNVASVGFENFNDYIKDAFNPNGNWQDMTETSQLISAGATISYASFLGPIDFDVSWVNDIDKIRVFFSIGLQFNRSN